MMTVAVSQCLAGIPCRYDGKASRDTCIEALVQRGEALCVCPELLGGMTTPRRPSEIIGGDGYDVLDGRARVIDSAGKDVTEFFIRGAQATLLACREHGICHAVLKAKSPSCGAGEIYDGSFTGSLKPGDGVTAALLKRNGISVEVR